MKLGMGIPYYKNSEECEVSFKKLMKTLSKQIGGNVKLMVYEDGQYSNWLHNYSGIKIYSGMYNFGVAVVRNVIKDYLIKQMKCDYIMFLDSDDMIDCDFVKKMYAAASTGNYDMLISRFLMNKKEMIYDKRSNVAGICLRADFIKDIRFNEKYNISEDSLFIEEVYKKYPKIYKIDSNYYYNYGVNPNSLMMRFERSEIKLMKESNK